MAEPFEHRSGSTGGRLSGFGTAKRKRAFIADLEAELARTEKITLVEMGRVEELARSREVDLENDCKTARRCLYKRFLEHCFNDYALSEEESEDLSHLQRLLFLDDADVQLVHDEVVGSVYGRAIDDVLQDYRLDREEKAFLAQLRVEIGLSEGVAEQLELEGTDRARQRFISQAAVHGSSLVATREAEIELQGRSEAGFQEAVEVAIESAGQTVEIGSATLKTLRVDVRDGKVSSWFVALTTRL